MVIKAISLLSNRYFAFNNGYFFRTGISMQSWNQSHITIKQLDFTPLKSSFTATYNGYFNSLFRY